MSTCSLDHFESERPAYQTELDSDVQTCIAGCSPGRIQQMNSLARIRLVAIAQKTRHDRCHAARDGIGEPPPRIKPFDSAPASLKQYRPWPDQRPVGPGPDAHEMRTAVEDERSDYPIYPFRIHGIDSSYDLGENAGAAGGSASYSHPPRLLSSASIARLSMTNRSCNISALVLFLKKHRAFLFNNREKILKVASRKNQTEKQGAQHEPVDGADLSACLPA